MVTSVVTGGKFYRLLHERKNAETERLEKSCSKTFYDVHKMQRSNVSPFAPRHTKINNNIVAYHHLRMTNVECNITIFEQFRMTKKVIHIFGSK